MKQGAQAEAELSTAALGDVSVSFSPTDRSSPRELETLEWHHRPKGTDAHRTSFPMLPDVHSHNA